MKPGYKIIIAGLLVYGGFKIKAVMDVAPYKERAVFFAGLLKQHKSFEAQALLSIPLQASVSIENLDTLTREQNLTQSKEITWLDWHKDDGGYTLLGEFVFEGEHRLPVKFILFSPEENKTWIKSVKVGDVDLGTTDENRTGFLE